jgi:hypothetical protein
MIPFASGSPGLQINTFTPNTPRNAWQPEVSSGCRGRQRPTAASPSHTSTRGTAPSCCSSRHQPVYKSSARRVGTNTPAAQRA